MPPRGAARGAERKEEPPILPEERAASAYSGETTSVTKTLPATIAASARLNAGPAFWVSHSSSFLRAATGARRTAGTARATARGLVYRGEEDIWLHGQSWKFEISGVPRRGGDSCGAHLTARPLKAARRAKRPAGEAAMEAIVLVGTVERCSDVVSPRVAERSLLLSVADV